MRSYFSLKSIMSAVGEKGTVILYTHIISRHPGTQKKRTSTNKNIVEHTTTETSQKQCSKTMSYGTEIQDS